MQQNKGIYKIRTKLEAKNLKWEVHAFNPSTQEAKAGRVPIQGQPGLHSKTLSRNTKQGIKGTQLRSYQKNKPYIICPGFLAKESTENKCRITTQT